MAWWCWLITGMAIGTAVPVFAILLITDVFIALIISSPYRGKGANQ